MQARTAASSHAESCTASRHTSPRVADFIAVNATTATAGHSRANSPSPPRLVLNVAFRKPPLGKRGYDEKEVDDFLDAVEQTTATSTEEVMSLRAQLGNGTSSTGAGGQGVSSTELEQIKDRLTRLEAIIANAGLRPPVSDPLFGDGR